MAHSSNLFLTEVAHDWSHNLEPLQQALRDAEDFVRQRTDAVADPLWDTPILPNVRGTVRWMAVQRFLQQATANGRLAGVAANWIPLGGVHQLELRGKYTTLVPCYLHTQEDSPRESFYRKARRASNYFQPALTGFEDSIVASALDDDLIHITLVHGGKEGEFAYFRAYYDAERRSYFKELSSNIMLVPSLTIGAESEQVLDPSVELVGKADLARKNAGA
ncbi:MAG: hypothetical protein ACYDC1_23370 [Limisphaerales bacterium]